MRVHLEFELMGEVLPEIFALRVAEACVSCYAIKPGDSIVEPRSGNRHSYEDTEEFIKERKRTLRSLGSYGGTSD